MIIESYVFFLLLSGGGTASDMCDEMLRSCKMLSSQASNRIFDSTRIYNELNLACKVQHLAPPLDHSQLGTLLPIPTCASSSLDGLTY